VSLYAVAFALMAAAGVTLVAASLGTLESLRLLRVSSWLSAGAIVAAVASVVAPRRR
jgi:hypothetical protein